MYINDLGAERTVPSADGPSCMGTANTVRGKRADNYAAVMKKAVNSVRSSYSSAGDIIIREAIEKMKTDPEWEDAVMNKVKEYYAGGHRTDSAQTDSLSWLDQYGLQNYRMQSLLGRNAYGLGLTGYTPYGYGGLAAAAYGSMMNDAFGGSLLGSWQL